MRCLVTGAAGQLGTHLVATLTSRGVETFGLTRTELDITDRDAVGEAIDVLRPDVVVNAAAYTAVDNAESDESTALRVNAAGPRHLAESLADRAGRLVHVSTDYVFDGRADRPYEIDDSTNPQTAYGRTKLAGELAIAAALPDRALTVRTAWVYGGPGPNFVDTMRRLERERETVDVVDDQIGSPTSVRDLATALADLVAADVDRSGTVHFVNTGRTSWWELARAVFSCVGADPDRVRPTSSDNFVRPAPRPSGSVLSTASWAALGLAEPRPWQEALTDLLTPRS
jgi:dTDP-4-dehydrorhamnose reductase